MGKVVRSLFMVGGGVALALALSAGSAVAADGVQGQRRAAGPTADYNCRTSAVDDDSRVYIYCANVNVGQVRGYAVCAGPDTNIATGWIAAPKSNYELTSTYKCRWGIRSHRVESKG